MDLTRTLQVKIDPGGAIAGGAAAANAFKSVGTSASDMSHRLRDANGRFLAMGGGSSSGGAGGASSGSGGGSMGAVVRGAMSMKAAFGLLGAVISSMSLVAFSRSLIQTKIAFDRMEQSIRYATGSASLGAESMDWLRRTSKDLGLDLVASGSAFAKFSAATRGTAIDFEETKRIFLSVAKASTVLGLSAEETAGALNAIQQMVSKGTVSAEELRGQLGERLPGAFNMAAKAMGVTTQQLGKLLETGQISAERMLPLLATELEKAFGGEAGNAAKSLNSELNRMGNAWGNFKNALMESGVADFFKWILEIVRKTIDELTGFLNYLKTVGGSLADFITAPFDPASLARLNAAIVSRATLGGSFGNPEPTPDDTGKVRNIGTVYYKAPQLSAMDRFRLGLGDQSTINQAELRGDSYKIKGQMEQWRKAGQESADAMAKSFTSLFGDLIDGTKSVTAAFRDMARNIISEIAKIVAYRAIAQPIANAILGSIGFTNGVNVTSASAPVSHIGSIVGQTGLPTRTVNPGIFAGAPRFHSGLNPDEFPAILQRGEAVIPKNQVRGMSGGGTSLAVTVNMNGGGRQEDGQAIGAEVARQVQMMMRSIIVKERMPRGALA